MRYFKYLALLTVLVLPALHSQAQVSIGVRIGPSYGIYNPPPVCPYGFYPDYPFGCAPYGYWGPEWFVNGVFVGAGPWYHFYYLHPEFYRRYYYVGRFDRFHEREFRDQRWSRDDGRRDFRDHDRGVRGVDRSFHGRDPDFRRGDHEFRRADRGFRDDHSRGERRGHGEDHDRGRR